MDTPKRSSNSADIKVFELDYGEVMRNIKDYAEKVVGNGLAELVILIGSLAKGTYSPFSDIDLVIVVKKSAEKPLDRIPAYIEPSLPLDVEPIVLTVDEFFQTVRARRTFAAEVIDNGMYLAGDRGLLEKAKELRVSYAESGQA